MDFVLAVGAAAGPRAGLADDRAGLADVGEREGRDPHAAAGDELVDPGRARVPVVERVPRPNLQRARRPLIVGVLRLRRGPLVGPPAPGLVEVEGPAPLVAVVEEERPGAVPQSLAWGEKG